MGARLVSLNLSLWKELLLWTGDVSSTNQKGGVSVEGEFTDDSDLVATADRTLQEAGKGLCYGVSLFFEGIVASCSCNDPYGLASDCVPWSLRGAPPNGEQHSHLIFRGFRGY